MNARPMQATHLRVGDEVKCSLTQGEVFLPVMEAYWRSCPPRYSGQRRYSVITFYVEPVPGHRLPVEKSDFDTVLVREKRARPPRHACATCERTWLTESEDDADETCPKCGDAVRRIS